MSAAPAGDEIRLAGLDRPLRPLGLGTWAWGDRTTWGMGGYDPQLDETTIAAAWEATAAHGVRLIDTAEVYGNGESERIIGRLLANDDRPRDEFVIASKFFPSPVKLNVPVAMRDACLASIERLGVDRIDLYQLHGPVSLRSPAVLAETLAGLHRDGLIRAIGVSNYSARETRTMHRALQRRGLPLSTNQIEYSPLRVRPERTGLLASCAALGVTVLAYSPLGQGRLTGKYRAGSPPPGRRRFSAHPMELVDRIVAALRVIGDAHDGRTPAQVVLRWIIQKGAVPIPGAKNAEQATQNAGALDWQLSAGDVATIDALALEGQRTLQQRVWQHG